MINFLIVTHGEFGAYLVEAAEAIVGRQASGVRVVSASSRLGVSEIRRRIGAAVAELSGPGGLVVFCDMPAGSPVNLSFPLIKDRAAVEIISGINLPMLISAFSHRGDMSLEALIEKVLRDGKNAVSDVRRLVMARMG